MGYHPYCIVSHDRSPDPAVEGLAGTRVRTLGVSDLAVWFSELETAPAPSVPALRTHDAVIRAAAGPAGPAPLPVRFGGWLDSRRALERRVRDRYEAYTGALQRLGDAREYGLRIFEPEERESGDPQGAQAGSGTEYMERLARRYAVRSRRARRADEVLRSLHDAVAGTAVDERTDRPSVSPTLLNIAHLVRPDDAEAYRLGVERFRSEHPALRAVSTGPWAPYSFAP